MCCSSEYPPCRCGFILLYFCLHSFRNWSRNWTSITPLLLQQEGQGRWDSAGVILMCTHTHTHTRTHRRAHACIQGFICCCFLFDALFPALTPTPSTGPLGTTALKPLPLQCALPQCSHPYRHTAEACSSRWLHKAPQPVSRGVQCPQTASMCLLGAGGGQPADNG